MKVLISPTKTMNASNINTNCWPLFQSKATILANEISKLSCEELQSWMGVSSKIAATTFQWYQTFGQHTQPAAVTYAGEGFKYLSYSTLDSLAAKHAQESLRILSALYGYLRPNDQISLYRLDLTYAMSRLALPSLITIYQHEVTDALLKETSENELILNCTSSEYTQLLDVETLKRKRNFLSIVFLQKKNSKISSISMHSKKARGIFARWAIEHQVSSIKDVQLFDLDGYTLYHIDDHDITYLKYLD